MGSGGRLKCKVKLVGFLFGVWVVVSEGVRRERGQKPLVIK